MNPGEFRNRITILKRKSNSGPVKNLDDKEVWTDYSNIWAKVEYIKGLKSSEFFAAKAVNAENSIKFIIRYRNDITTNMAVRFNGRVLNIEYAAPIDCRNSLLLIIAREVINSE